MTIEVSVIIPYFNRRETLVRALESVRGQTYGNLEIILIDDGSTDDSWTLVEEYARSHPDVPVVHLRQANKGPAAARNNGIAHASGEFIAFLDSDDSWEPEKLEVQMRIVRDYSADLVSCNSNIITPYKISKKYYSRKEVEKIDYRMALVKYYTSTPCVVVKRSSIQDVGGFPEDMRIGEDMVVFYRVIRQFNGYVSGRFLTNIHKELFGQSGLSGDMRAGHLAILDSIRVARRENSLHRNKVGFPLFVAAMSSEILKYYRRLAIVAINRFRRMAHGRLSSPFGRQ